MNASSSLSPRCQCFLDVSSIIRASVPPSTRPKLDDEITPSIRCDYPLSYAVSRRPSFEALLRSVMQRDQ
jgi:hypothetical protein